MSTSLVVVLLEVIEFSLKIGAGPERRVIEQLTSDCADQSLDERMRQRNVRDGLDLADIKYAQIGFPAVEFEQRVIV